MWYETFCSNYSLELGFVWKETRLIKETHKNPLWIDSTLGGNLPSPNPLGTRAWRVGSDQGSGVGGEALCVVVFEY